MGQVLIQDQTKLKPLNKKISDLGFNAIYRSTKRTLTCHELSDGSLAAMYADTDTADIDRYAVLERYGLMFEQYKVDSNKELALNKAIASSELQQLAERFRQAVLFTDYTKSEVIGFVDKLYIAEKVIAATASAEEIQAIELEATNRGLGETAAELAAKQIEKGQRLRLTRSIIDGRAKNTLSTIDACTANAEIAIAVSSFITNVINDIEAL